MALPNKFLISGESTIASYNFTDLVTRTGYVTLYAVAGVDGTIRLCPEQIASASAYTSTTDSSDDGAVVEQEKDIDITFTVPQTIQGNLFVTMTYTASNGNGVATTSAFCKCRIYHVTSGGTETEIGTQQTGPTVTATSGSPVITDTRETFVFAITRKLFKNGEKLRVNVELWGTIGTNGSIAFYHDGANQDISGRDLNNANLPTNLIANVPFRPDI